MKVLLGIHHFPPKYKAGAEMQAYRTAKALQFRGVEVEVACIEGIIQEHGANRAVISRDQFDAIPVNRIELFGEFPSFPSRDEYDNEEVGHVFHSLFTNFQPDLYHQFGGYLLTGKPIEIASNLGIPTVLTLVDFWFLCPRIQLLRSNGELSSVPVDPSRCVRCLMEERLRYRVPGAIAPGLMDAFWDMHARKKSQVESRNRRLMEILDIADQIVAPSKFLKEMYARASADELKIEQIRQGLDLNFARKNNVGRMKEPILILGYIGQIAPHKGLHTLFNALQILKGAPLEVHIYGDVSQDPRYYQQLRNLQGRDERIFFKGTFTGEEEMDRVYRSIDLLVVPSECYENSPNVILEAFSFGIPVIASDLGGMAELVEGDTNGLLFRPQDERDLAHQIRRIFQQPQFLDNLRSGIRPVQTIEQEIDTLLKIFGRAIESDPGV